jgi:DNA repair protein RadC
MQLLRLRRMKARKMEALEFQDAYGPTLSQQIESMGDTARRIANRWMMGWPEQTKSLVASGAYLVELKAQIEVEKDVLAEAGDLQHLATHEILKLNEIREAPPTL